MSIDKRIFWTNHGWYIYMRPSDEPIKTFVTFRSIEIKKVADRYVAGPFKSKPQLQNWLSGFLQQYATPREYAEYIEDHMILPEGYPFGKD